ncbi:MAG: radical SAM protein [Deltaproteobacteria bacterium]|nr:radical SAM protein [Deltaproteobacteria bacterium]
MSVSHWSLIEEQRRRLAAEVGTLHKQAPVQIALAYPSPYHVGMSSLGFQTIYRELHLHPQASAERAFLPDDVAALRAARAPLLTYEGERPIAELPVLAFSVAYELELTGVCEMLDLAGLPVLARERDASMPLVIAGGPLTFSNPVPLSPFVDVILMGEAEQLVHELCDLIAGAPAGPGGRALVLDTLAARPGFWVPGHPRGLAPVVARADDERLPARSQIVTPHTELSSMFLIEPERGCSRGCTYCVMRRTTNGGMRTVEPERVLGLVPDHARKVGLVGAAVTDHPRIVPLLRTLVDAGRQVGISSLRADRLSAELVGLLARSGARTLTTASDGASERLRDAIDRKTKEKHLLAAAQLARDAGMRTLKLYLMLGLPGETSADLDELVRFGSELSKIIPLAYGVAPFVAKRNTPMDGAPFAGVNEVEHKLGYLRAALRGRAELRATSARWAWVEYMLSQGDESAGLAAMDAWRAGGSFAAWKRAFKERGATPRGAQRPSDGRLRLPALAAWPTAAP